MKRFEIKRILFVLLIGLVMSFEPALADLVLSTSGEVTPSQLVPGSDGYIKLTIDNIGSQDLPAIYVKLVSLDTPLVLENKADLESVYIGGINTGGSVQKIYKFKVPGGTPSGTYSAGYTVSQSTGEGSRLIVSGYVLIPVQASSSLIVKSLSPNTFRPGERAKINLTLSNVGDARLSDLVVTWQTSGDLILPLGLDNKVTRRSMEPMSSVDLPIDIVVNTNAAPGVYPFIVKTTYHDQSGSEKTANSTIGIVIERLAGTDISVRLTPSSFNPGERKALTFDIANIGDSNLNDLTISWQAKEDVILPLGQVNTIFIKSLGAGKDVSILVASIVNRDAIPAIYPLNVKATYSDEKGIQKTANFTIGISIGGLTDFQVSLQEVSGTTTSFSIGNIGLSSATAISVSIPQQEGFSAIGPSEVFVGNLDPGDFTVASFQLRRQREGNLKVKIAYTDSSGNRATLEKQLAGVSSATPGVASQGRNLGAGNSQSGTNSGSRYLTAGAAGMAGIALLYMVWRRKKQK